MMNITKIKSVTSLGFKKSYNIEMESSQHNYLTRPHIGQPVHKNSHSCSYIMVAYWCAWLKAHFPEEWYASVMSTCHSDRIPKYMSVAKKDGVTFGTLNVRNLTKNFSVQTIGDEIVVTFGLISIKGIGEKVAEKIEGKHDNINSIDDFIKVHGKSKSVLERLIKLGSFKRFHSNVRATWMWYCYKYATGKDITLLRKSINDKLVNHWTDDAIKNEIKRQTDEYKKMYPKRRRIPNKIVNWKPKPDNSRENVMALFEDDFELSDFLEFEREYLGYYLSNPMDSYEHTDGRTIDDAMRPTEDGICVDKNVEVVIDKVTYAKTKNGDKMAKVTINDGVETINVILWSNQIAVFKEYLCIGNGVRMCVLFDPERRTFTMSNGSVISPLRKINEE